MPFALALLVINVVCVVHAAKTGRFSPWGYLIILLPGVGALAYVVVELVPEWIGSPRGRRAQQRVANALDPERRYRDLADQLAISDTIATRAALAEECLNLGKLAEAEAHFDNALARPLGDNPTYAFGKARAQLGLGRPQETVATLDALRAQWPDYQSAEAHLLYARALEESGRAGDALDEYAAVASYFPGLEARVRHGQLLAKEGRQADAKAVFTEVLTQVRRAPRYVRKAQAEWIAIAERELRG